MSRAFVCLIFALYPQRQHSMRLARKDKHFLAGRETGRPNRLPTYIGKKKEQ